MSANPERAQTQEDRIISLLSHWLARHVETTALAPRLDEIGTDELEAGQAEAVEEVRAELDRGAPRAVLERVVRETVESLALGV